MTTPSHPSSSATHVVRFESDPVQLGLYGAGGILAGGLMVWLARNLAGTADGKAALGLGAMLLLGGVAMVLHNPSWSVEVDPVSRTILWVRSSRFHTRRSVIPFSSVGGTRVARIGSRNEGERFAAMVDLQAGGSIQLGRWEPTRELALSTAALFQRTLESAPAVAATRPEHVLPPPAKRDMSRP